MLRRIKDAEAGVPLHPEKEELKAYIRRRLDEGHLSVRQLALGMGYRVEAIYKAFSEGGVISLPLLSRMLWIVDGDDCPYRYGRAEMKERIDPASYLDEHPEVRVDEWDAENWIIRDDNDSYIYDKLNHSLPDALAEYDKTRTK